MKKVIKTRNRGFLKWIVMLVIAVIIASYFFDFNVQKAVEDEQTQSNFQYIGTQLKDFYEHAIEPLIDSIKETINEFTNNDEVVNEEPIV